jgi:Tfp pilus assembly protein PilV
MSVVEVLVALVIVTAGLLAVAGSSALALRTSLDASRRRLAAHRVATRFAQLQALGCANIATGSDAGGTIGVAERWTVVSRSASHVIVTDSVSWMGVRGQVRRTLTTAIAC